MNDLPTVGAEEEFLLVDQQTGESAPRNAEVAAEAERRGITLQLELSSCQVETTSSVVQTSGQLGEELARLRRVAAQAAQACGLQLLALALPPVTPHEFPVTDTERYRRIGAQFGMVAHEQGICGCHVHVEVPGRPAAIITFLEGVWPRKPSAAHCAGVGEVLAKMHLAGRDFSMSRANALSVAGWRPLFDGSRRHIDNSLAQELESELDFFEKNWPCDLPAGVIHADLFNDNVLFLHDKLSGLIDFYFACNDAFAYDVAICLNAWCFETDKSFNATKARALLQGYGKVRPLDDHERGVLPLLARGAALRFLLTRLYDWVHTPADALVKRKDPQEYLAKLRFHRGTASIADYGL